MKRTPIVVALSILTFISIVLMKLGVESHGVNLGAILLALVIGYLILSLGTVKVGEVAMMAVFGKPVGNIKPGLFFAPLGIVSVRKEEGTVFQDELPANPEHIFRGDGSAPTGMFPPNRVKFGQPKDSDPPRLKADPYHVPMVAEVVPVVSWHITDAMTFFAVMGSVANCKKQMSDKAIELCGNKFADITPAQATLILSATSDELEAKLKTETSTWGITINDAYIKPIVFSHHLNDAVVAVKIADQNAKAAVLAAEGAAQTVKLAADAEKHRLVATGLAEVDATGKITKLLPDAHTNAIAGAISALAKTTGTVVLGGELQNVLNIKQ